MTRFEQYAQPKVVKEVKVREIRVIDLILYFYVPLLVIIAVWIVYPLVIYPFLNTYRFLFLAAFIILTYFMTQRFLIGAVLMYKAYAPLEVRARCRYTPTCSTYMVICLQKFGVIRGTIKGIRRITRCRPPYGGEDYPYSYGEERDE